MNPEAVAAAAFMAEDAFIDPYRLAMAYARAARMYGASLRQRIAVRDLRQQGERITGVVTDQGVIYAGCVVDAAGAWANVLAARIGIGLPMAPVRSQYWITAPDPLFPRDHPMVIMPDASAYSRPELGGLLFGLRERQSISFDPRQLPDELSGFALGEEGGWSSLEEGASRLRRFLPALDPTEDSQPYQWLVHLYPGWFVRAGTRAGSARIFGRHRLFGCRDRRRWRCRAGRGPAGRRTSQSVRSDAVPGRPFRSGRSLESSLPSAL
ncbi:MAG: FAD-dependent oxidoreductase [Candidatus Competibacteraceae bacterium]